MSFMLFMVKKSVLINKQSIIRSLAVVAVIIAVLFIGHYGLRLFGRRHFAGPPRATAGAGGHVPLPPGARETNRLPGNRGIMARYLVRLEADDLAAFYREQMPRYGWRAAQSKRGSELPGIWMLSYSNSAGEVCTIGISKAEQGGASLNIIVLPHAQRTAVEPL